MRCSSFFSALGIILMAATSPMAATSAKVQVVATVVPFVALDAVQHVTTVRVEPEDLKKGYIDLPHSLTVSLKTNLNTGVPVVVQGSEGFSVLVRETGTAEYQGNTVFVDTAHYRPNTPIRKTYDSRILFSADAQKGTYPLSLSIAPAI